MKIQGTPQKVYEALGNKLDTFKEDKEVILYVSTRLTREIRTKYQNDFIYWLCEEIGKHLWEKKEDVKRYFLIGCFWSRKVKLSKIEVEMPLKPETSKLTKEEAIFYIETLMKFIQLKNIPCKYSPAELRSLLESYS